MSLCLSYHICKLGVMMPTSGGWWMREIGQYIWGTCKVPSKLRAFSKWWLLFLSKTRWHVGKWTRKRKKVTRYGENDGEQVNCGSQWPCGRRSKWAILHPMSLGYLGRSSYWFITLIVTARCAVKSNNAQKSLQRSWAKGPDKWLWAPELN